MSRRYTEERAKARAKASKKSLAKKVGIVVIILLILYVILSIYFRSHYYFGTTIEGIACGGKNVEEVKGLISESMKEYSITLYEKGYRQEHISADDVNLIFADDGTIDSILEKQSGFGWLFSVFMDNNYEGYNVSLDEDAFTNTVQSLHVMDENYVTKATSAREEFDKGTGMMVIMKERAGNKLEEDQFLDSLKKAILNRDREFDLAENDCYKQPKVTSDSKELSSKVSKMNKYCKASITYDFDDRTEVVDGSVICDWLYFSDDGEVHLDESCVTNYVSELAAKYDTVGITRKFKAISGNTIEVSGGTYGWAIDQEDEADALLSDIVEGNVVKREPDYYHIAKSRKKNDVGDTYVDVDLSAQYVYCYKDGKIITEGSCVTGNIGLGRGTPSGSFYIIGKDTSTYLVGVGYRSYVNFWMPITDTGIGLHDAPWRGSFGGSIYVYNGSHGCINLPYYLASEIYQNIEATYPVIVHW